uniref:uncharacterized protein LOC107000288 n=1 Tax=Macaca mulatta TaxID=9544 RepID=UPI00073287D7|nr:uncharacterized protein LOC107000288 [Macaca mulatta]XP_015312248.1 uncharacterized protein LOC107130899 [Macaca fascicularis]
MENEFRSKPSSQAGTLDPLTPSNEMKTPRRSYHPTHRGRHQCRERLDHSPKPHRTWQSWNVNPGSSQAGCMPQLKIPAPVNATSPLDCLLPDSSRYELGRMQAGHARVPVLHSWRDEARRGGEAGDCLEV